MKEIIINFFKTDRTYDGAVALIIKFSKKLSLIRQVNVQPESPHMKGVIFEELRELGGITHEYLNIMLKNKVKPGEPVMKPGEAHTIDPVTMPQAVIGVVKLRKEFPFLGRKNCPDQLKILVADKITAYEDYVKGHEALYDPEKILKVSGPTVEAFLNNRDIFAELNHYKETGQLLGKHPIFAQGSRIEEIRKMSVPELVKLKDSLTNNIDRTKKKIKDDPKHKETKNRKARVKEQEKELAEVKQLLKIPAGKNGK